MEAYAIIGAGGKQYTVRRGETVSLEHMNADVGASVELRPVLALSNGQELRLGTPDLADASVKAEVLSQIRAPKVVAFQKRRRKGSSRKHGHRQCLTVLKITDLG